MVEAFINRIATAVPSHDVHRFFHRYAASLLSGDPRRRALFLRMAERSGIEHRFSCFAPGDDPDGASLDREGTFRRGGFPGTGTRMEMYRAAAPVLGAAAVDGLLGADEARRVTHLIVTSCTGFSAPGLDLELDRALRAADPSVERTIVGFMGCYAAINALKLARHIVRSEPAAQRAGGQPRALHPASQGDGRSREAAVLPALGRRLRRRAGHRRAERAARSTASQLLVAPESAGTDDLEHPRRRLRHAAVGRGARRHPATLVCDAAARGCSAPAGPVEHRPVGRPSGRPLGARRGGARASGSAPTALAASREVLRRFGNMSSATVMFVLDAMLRQPPARRARLRHGFRAGAGRRDDAVSRRPAMRLGDGLAHRQVVPELLDQPRRPTDPATPWPRGATSSGQRLDGACRAHGQAYCPPRRGAAAAACRHRRGGWSLHAFGGAQAGRDTGQRSS